MQLLARTPWLERVIINGGRYDPQLAEPSNWTATVTRDHLALAWRGSLGFGMEFRELPEVLGTLDRPGFTSLEVTGTRAGQVDDVRRAVGKIIATWPKLATSRLFQARVSPISS